MRASNNDCTSTRTAGAAQMAAEATAVVMAAQAAAEAAEVAVRVKVVVAAQVVMVMDWVCIWHIPHSRRHIVYMHLGFGNRDTSCDMAVVEEVTAGTAQAQAAMEAAVALAVMQVEIAEPERRMSSPGTVADSWCMHLGLASGNTS